MEQSSVLSSNSSHDEIEEIPSQTPMDVQSDSISNASCTCQCHLSSDALNNEYLLFEQALRQTRLEQEQEKSLKNNPLIQTLKRQHEELMSFYQQNKKFTRAQPVPKIDREQQTSKIPSHDSEIQTDLIGSTPSTTKPSVQSSSLPVSTSAATTTPLPPARPQSTNSSSIGRPRLSTNSKTNGITTTTSSPVPSPSQTSPNAKKPTVPPAPPATTATTRVAHDVVDLTEEDEEDDASRVPMQRTAATFARSTPTVRYVSFLSYRTIFLCIAYRQHRHRQQQQQQRRRP